MQINQVLLRDDAVLITASERIARELRSRRAILKADAGQEVWDDSGFIGPFKRFLTDAWFTLFDDRQLLHNEQLLTLCKQAVDQSPAGASSISTMAMARSLRQAERILVEYRLPLDRQDFAFGAELSAFYGWHQNLQSRLDRDNYVLECSLPDLILQAASGGAWAPPKAIFLVGFLTLTPQQDHFVQRLRALGVDIQLCEPQQLDARCIKQHKAHSNEEEIRSAAHWFKQRLASHEKRDGPARMALIVPALENHRKTVARVLEETLAPHALLAGRVGESVEYRKGYAFAGGDKLAAFPWVRRALDLLSVRNLDNPSELLSRILLNYAGPLDRGLRHAMAGLDLKLREDHGWLVPAQAFLGLLKSSLTSGAQNLASSIHEFLLLSAEKRLPSEWADIFEQFIMSAGLLNEESLTRPGLHEWWAFQEALDIYRSLDAQMGLLPIDPAFRWLDEVCNARWHSEEASTSAVIQVLSPGEAVGLSFDYAWICGLHSKQMPEQTDPNPFLPLHRQVAAGVPSACPRKNLKLSKLLLDALMKISSNVVLSYPSHNEGANLIPSGLIKWKSLDPVTYAANEAPAKQSPQIKLVSAQKDVFPAVSAEERRALASAVSIVADSASDPLSAALIHRLHLKPFPAINAGLSGAVQGQLIHETLRHFWLEVRTSDRLHSLTEHDLQPRVANAVAEAMNRHKACTAERYGERLLRLERWRLTDLVLDWLAQEKEREEPFEVVWAEMATTVKLGDLQFEVRIDRIDKVSCKDGQVRYLLADYKSGKLLDFSGMNAAKLTEPQLPIYATFGDFTSLGIEAPDGVALASVHPETLRFISRTSWTSDLLGKNRQRPDTSQETWQYQLDCWRESVTSVVEGFMGGNSELHYRPHEYLGYHAHLAPLMRLGETTE